MWLTCNDCETKYLTKEVHRGPCPNCGSSDIDIFDDEPEIQSKQSKSSNKDIEKQPIQKMKKSLKMENAFSIRKYILELPI